MRKWAIGSLSLPWSWYLHVSTIRFSVIPGHETLYCRTPQSTSLTEWRNLMEHCVSSDLRRRSPWSRSRSSSALVGFNILIILRSYSTHIVRLLVKLHFRAERVPVLQHVRDQVHQLRPREVPGGLCEDLQNCPEVPGLQPHCEDV